MDSDIATIVICDGGCIVKEKSELSESRPVCRVVRVTLLERIDWVIAHRKAQITNQTIWSEKSGLNKGHLGVMRKRLRTNPRADIERATLDRMAKAAGVSVRWLVSGEGEPLDSQPAMSPAQESAVGKMRQAIDLIMRNDFSGTEGFSESYWTDMLLKTHAEIAKHGTYEPAKTAGAEPYKPKSKLPARKR